MKIGPSKYVTTKSDAYTAILDWIQATEEFHRYHSKINEILNEKKYACYTNSTTSSSTDRSRRISRLGKLQQHMNDVLETLLVDMNRSVAASNFNDPSNLSKAGRLVTHARLLREINQKISRELLIFTAFQA